jgi:hypothetical protein
MYDVASRSPFVIRPPFPTLTNPPLPLFNLCSLLSILPRRIALGSRILLPSPPFFLVCPFISGIQC